MKNQTASQTKIQKMVGLAIFTAVIVVLQLVATFVKVGPISITLTLIPIVVGAAVYGKGAGAYLGGVFSVVVIICCITGADAGGAMIWNANPFLCVVVCMLKGMAAGFVAGLLYRLISQKSVIGGAVVSDYQRIGGIPDMDYSYTVFGQVFEGIEVVDAIAGTQVVENPPYDNEFSLPAQDIVIERIEILEYEG